MESMAPKAKKVAARPMVSAKGVIKEYAKPNFSATAQQAIEAQKLAVFLQNYMDEHCREFVAGRGDGPLLQFYSNDGTPIKTHKKCQASAGGVKIRCEGKRSKEYLVQMILPLPRPPWESPICLLLRPLPLCL